MGPAATNIDVEAQVGGPVGRDVVGGGEGGVVVDDFVPVTLRGKGITAQIVLLLLLILLII